MLDDSMARRGEDSTGSLLDDTTTGIHWDGERNLVMVSARRLREEGFEASCNMIISPGEVNKGLESIQVASAVALLPNSKYG